MAKAWENKQESRDWGKMWRGKQEVWLHFEILDREYERDRNQPSLAFDTVSCMGPGPIDGDRQSFALRVTDGNISCTLPLFNRHVVVLQVCSLPCPNKHQAQPWLKAGERAGNRPSHMFIQPWLPHGPAIVLLSGTEWACRGVRASRMTSPAGGKRGQTGCFYFCPAWYSWSFIPLR